MKPFTLLALLLLSSPVYLFAQPAESAVTSLDKISKQLDLINKKYLRYMSEMAHGKNAKKAVKKHQDLLGQIDKAKYALVEIPYYKGDKSLHESTNNYLALISNLQKENYDKVLNLEEIAEKSYDDMEAYLLFKRKINERMDEAMKDRQKSVQEYCDRNNIKLLEAEKTEESEKLKKIDEVMEYYEKVYLIFFKASLQDDKLVEAIKKNNLTAIEQIKGSLASYAQEGLDALSGIKSYRGSDALKSSAKKAMEFFKKEAAMVDDITDHIMKEEDFKMIKKNFEKNAKAQDDKAEIKKFNNAVEEINKAAEKSNKANDKLNSGRSAMIEDWNNAVDNYMDTHVPYS